MKRFLSRLLLFSIFIIMLLAFSISRITIGWQGDYLFALADKFENLKTEKQPKIICIGGSNLAFGMESEIISQYYDMPVVNMGIHVGLGLRFLLEGIKPYVKKDDIVLIIPEYGHFYNIYLGRSSTLTPIIFNVYPQSFKYLSFEQYLMVFSGMPRQAMDNLDKAYIKGHAFKNHTQNIYARDKFNRYGDVTSHWYEQSYTSYTYKKQDVRPIDSKMMKELEDYIVFYQKKGAKVVILPPAIIETVAKSIEGEIQQVEAEFTKKDNVAFHYFYPARYSLPDSLGYDTRYHFLKPGIDIRMQYLIEDLDVFLKENDL